MQPLILAGQNAFSQFRIDAILNDIQENYKGLDVSEITAGYVYFLEVNNELSAEDGEKVYALLGADGTFVYDGGFFITPRKGAISPWSSKASDILHNCGLDDVVRVERGIYYCLINSNDKMLGIDEIGSALNLLYDRMTEGVYTDVSDVFMHPEPKPYESFDILGVGRSALEEANKSMGLALSDEEIDYLYESYCKINRNPTDVELLMFGQVNSEHCRHKIFNADWIIDGKKMDESLFGMIRNTHRLNPEGTLIAYKDNSGVMEGFPDRWFEVNSGVDKVYNYTDTQIDMIMKVETHNHPTAISPYPGAATGVGGEIRDEGATGTGSKSKAGLAGFMVSNLRVPDFEMPWEKENTELPSRLAPALDIMTEGPIGGARFGNEFGRPQLCGFFKTFEQSAAGRFWGYHKPIMVAGGMGNIKRIHVEKNDIPAGSYIIQIGGPAMKIGIGGGAASSMDTGTNLAELDFNSVQRDNAEMERRCQDVINSCVGLNDKNPILSIHDIGAGGLSNGCPELVAETGGKFELRAIHNEDKSMSPMEIWCCEAQERYVLAVLPDSLELFLSLCKRERCPVAVVGQAVNDKHLSLTDEFFDNKPIDIDIGVILEKPPKMLRDVVHAGEKPPKLDLSDVTPAEALERVLHLPAVANKTFLITIADRSITGLVARDQMVGPYQTPVADVAVTATSFEAYTGEAMAMGERSNIAIIDGPASGKMAIGESLTNIAASYVKTIKNIKLSANWMCACGEEGEDAALFDTVKAVGIDLCPELGISIPVGKDSLSMRTVWNSSDGQSHKMIAPLSLVVTAFSTVADIRKTVTPDLKNDESSSLWLFDLGLGKNRLGGSALAQVYEQVGCDAPDLDDADMFVRFFNAVQEMLGNGLLLAYHDRSDGGLAVTLSEMAIAGRVGVDVELLAMGSNPLAALFSEELGAVVQVSEDNVDQFLRVIEKYSLSDTISRIGKVIPKSVETSPVVRISIDNKLMVDSTVIDLDAIWSELTYKMQALRDNPLCAKEEYNAKRDISDPGMNFKVSYDPDEEKISSVNISSTKPRMAILREQGINGQVEMAGAFDRAGFESVDVHMTDLLSGRVDLSGFHGLVACGGFSYGDVLGAGSGWAKSILYNENLKEMFADFFAREETFSLGVCNGCQMLSQLRDIIPGGESWPALERNISEQFEARYVTVKIEKSPSIFFDGMEGSLLGIAVAHGEGRVDFSEFGSLEELKENNLIAMRYVDNNGNSTERYPFNPNGSPSGITSMTSLDGRATILMPHPERGFRSIQLSYRPKGLFENEDGPWMRMFRNARAFV